MTENELKERLGKALKRAVKQYIKDGGPEPKRGESVVCYEDGEGACWSLDVSWGYSDPEGVYY